jgi:hypothetical protein
MAETSALKVAFEELTVKLRETVKVVETYQVTRPETVIGSYDIVTRTENFFRDVSEPLYDSLYHMTNLLEDHIRSVYLFMDDATLEGHATELENHLAQLRMCGDDIRSVAKNFNEEACGIFTGYMTMLKMTLEADEIHSKMKNPETYVCPPMRHVPYMERILLINQICNHVSESLKDYKETCIKLLSIMAITIGRWETKLEDRVVTEDFNEGMIMSNMEAGGSISSKKKGKRRQKDNLYM